VEETEFDQYIFLNFTAVAIGVMFAIYLKDKWQANKKAKIDQTLPL
jgi:hypothetical protein